MKRTFHSQSAATRVFVVLLVLAVAAGATAAALLSWSSQTAARAEATQNTEALAATLAVSPTVIAALDTTDPASSSRHAVAQEYAHRVEEASTLDFVTVMTPDGVRVTHPDPDEVGKHYVGTIPPRPSTLTEQFTGTLGPSIRTIAPVMNGSELRGWVAVGVTVESLGDSVLRRLPAGFAVALGIVVAGSIGALLARHYTRKIAGDLPAGTVRDAVSAYESMRTLGEALQAQTHEHGNRLHTAVALLELGRTQEAIDLLTESSRQSQALVDQVAARRQGDPTVGALLLGKASQAKERGVAWETEIDPDAASSVLSPVDSVSVLGNLIDNALDAVMEAEHRWVRVQVSGSTAGWVTLTVSDSGPGIPADVRQRMFDHGFSTKAHGRRGRGIGLALVKSLVEGVGGTVRIRADPTTFEVNVPAQPAGKAMQ